MSTGRTPHGRIGIDRDTFAADAASLVRAWVEEHVPGAWREAAPQGTAAIRAVRTRAASARSAP